MVLSRGTVPCACTAQFLRGRDAFPRWNGPMADDPDKPDPADADLPEPAGGDAAPEGAAASGVPRGPLGPEDAVEQVEDAAAAVAEAATAAGEPVAFDLPEIGDGPELPDDPAGINLLNDVKMKVQVELGRTRMYVEDVLRLNPESVIELDKAAGDPVDIYVNDRHVARGEVLVLNDNFCVRISEIIRGPAASEEAGAA